MESRWALIKDGKVDNIVMATPAFLSQIQGSYDHVERVDNFVINGLQIGDWFVYETNSFIMNRNDKVIVVQLDNNQVVQYHEAYLLKKKKIDSVETFDYASQHEKDFFSSKEQIDYSVISKKDIDE